MKHIKLYEQFLTEKKVQVKRKWGLYPAKKTSTTAKVRNAVFNAMNDGVITEEEIKKILTEIGANKRWLSRNKKLFVISELDGITSYGLSKFGKRIFDAISLTEDVHRNPNMNTQGMGAIEFPDGDKPGSGDIPVEDEEE